MKSDTPYGPFQHHFRRHAGPYLLAGIFLLVLFYQLYRHYQLQQRFKREEKALIREIQAKQLASDRRQLLFSMKTFGWAVRNAMLQNKMGEINEYFNTLVQNPGVREILLVDSAGKVMISTNKKNEGAAFVERFPAALIRQEDIYFTNRNPYQLSAPILAPTKRLGTLVMIYAPTWLIPDFIAID